MLSAPRRHCRRLGRGRVQLWFGRWKRARGYAAPAIAGDRLVFFHRIQDQEVIECREAATGKLLWNHRYPTDYQDAYGFGNGPRATPVIAREHGLTYGVQGWLHCFKLSDGAIVWRRQLSQDYAVPQDFFGVGTTPLVVGDSVLVNVGAPAGPCVVSLSFADGTTQWESASAYGPSYSSPVAARVHDQDCVFVFAGGKSRPATGGLLALRPKDGAIMFDVPWRARKFESVNAATPVVVGDQVFVSESYGPGGILLEIQPDFTAKTVWKTDQLRNHFATSIYQDGYLYGLDGGDAVGVKLVCLELASGTLKWREELSWEDEILTASGVKKMSYGIARGNFIAADGDFLALGENGHLLWLRMDSEGVELLSRHWLFAARSTWTPPAISRGLVYICQNEPGFAGNTKPRLLCYDLRSENNED